MPRDEAYRRAEEKIEAARRSGAKKLDLSGFGQPTKITELPESLGELTYLEALYAVGNELATLPEWLCRFSQLKELYLFNNRLTALPESLAGLARLERLSLSGNRLTMLPESLCELKQLQALYLDSNRLTALPGSMARLTLLKKLNVAGNQLTELPEALCQLTELQKLDFSGNRLIALPNAISQLTKLEKLDVADNALAGLPSAMRRLAALRELYLHKNEALGIPAEILGPTYGDVHGPELKAAANPAAIVDYYFSTRGAAGRPLRELKLVVVGRGGAGKTSLVRRLNGEPLNPGESETHGIKISSLELDCQDGPVTARVWDFGGQHVLHAMHEFFLTARSLYLLVLGGREDMAERDAAYWLQLVRSYAGRAPVVVALNKSLGRPRDIDRESLEKTYGPIVAWVPTECAAGHDKTIATLRTALTDAADAMHEVRDLFPAKWWQIKEWLEEMKSPYLDFGAYQARCRELGEVDPAKQETLAARLNDLGIAINYAADERLHDTTVLRPDWLANGIYAILRANDAHHERPYAPDATLTVESLGAIYQSAEKLGMLKAVDYRPEMWPFLLRLMALFQLAFPVDEQGKILLVPALLPLEPPEGSDEPADPDRTRVRHEFDVVPGPLLPKLLVRTFSLIAGTLRWRRGAILSFGAARARVWTTQDERWLHITAAGNAIDRQELLTIIRLTLRELFAEYKDLRVVEQWEHNGKWVPRETLEEFGVLEREDKREEVP